MFCSINGHVVCRCVLVTLLLVQPAFAAPVIDPIGNVNVPAGKSLIIPVTASSPNGRPLTFTATSSTNRIAVEVHTNNPFWKMSVVHAAPANAPGAFQTPFRGGFETVTNIGDMTFMLFRDIAPHSVDVIQGFTMSGLYTSNTIFHRVVLGFVIQGGDPNTNGTGGPVFRYDDELNPNAIFSGNGQLALANSGKDTDGSQFFITSGSQRSLDFGYTIFGQLLRGFGVLTNIINTPTNSASRPLADVIITRASFVPDNFDTVLTLTATNLAGVAGTISVVADDGAGGRMTNTFTATALTDTNSNFQPLLYGNPMTNLVTPANVTLTNFLNAVGLDGEQLYWFFPPPTDPASISAYTNSSANVPNSIFRILTYNVINTNGSIKFFTKPATNYVGPATLTFVVSSSSSWGVLNQLGVPPSLLPPYDQQKYTFVFGDSPIFAEATNFTVFALTSFTNQLMVTFTNGVPDSAATNFTAFIDWGDNSTNNGVIVTNLFNQKEVYGSHIYTNSGNYPVYITIQSYLGASATVVSTASVPPNIGLTTAGTNNIIAWLAWATDYQLQSTINLIGANWLGVTNFPALNGYESIVTNSMTNEVLFFRLKK
jgi:cyclophilin family peptidyl-prolyl cis-trans isomerase